MRFFSALRRRILVAPDLFALLLLIVIVASGWSLRSIHRADWDGYGALIHPDEYHVADRVTTSLRVPDTFGAYLRTECPLILNKTTQQLSLIYPRDPRLPLAQQEPSASSGCNSLNPRSLAWNHGHVYGSWPTTIVRFAAETYYSATPPDQITRNQIVIIGRIGSTLADLLIVVLLYVMGRRLANRRVGLLAALLYAWTPFAIQQAHFFVVDAQAAAYGVLALYFCLRLAQGARWGSAIGAGLAVALAVASKINLAPIVLVIVAAVMQREWAHERSYGDPWAPSSMLGRAWRVFGRSFPTLVVAGIVTIVGLRLAMPDAFRGTNLLDLRPDHNFLEALGAASFNSSGQLDFPPSHQWASRINYIYELRNMIVWAMGVPLGLSVWLAWAALGIGMLRRASRHLLRWLPLWFWVTFYFGWQGSLPLKSMRYLLPIYGPLVLFGAWGLVALVGWAARAERPRVFRRAPLRAVALSIAGVVVGSTLLWGWGFSRIYARPHTRIAAAEWARANIPPGSTVSSDSWDIGIPRLDGSIWPGVELKITAEDRPEKTEQLIQALDQADYLAFTSNRAYGSFPQLPLRFPASLNYFKAVFDGSLGFEKVADFSSYPSFLGIAVPDDGADEGWSVYDHPRVTIWHKTERWSPERARQIMGANVNYNEIYRLKPIDATPIPTMLQLTVDRWLQQRDASSWRDVFGGVANHVPLLAWLLVIESLGLAAWGILWRCHLPLPDRGLGIARLAGLLLLGWIAWLPPSLKLLPYSRVWIGLVALAIVAIGGRWLWRDRTAMRAWARDRRGAIIASQSIYVVAFGLLLLIRYLNPDLWHPVVGGEKPMNLAYLTATLKSTAFPPYDPWFAGGYMNYYYWGYVLVGTPMKLLGLDPAIGFNLALPLLYGITAQLAASIGYNLWSSLHRVAARVERGAIGLMIVAALALTLLGNLAQVVLYTSGLRVVGNPTLSFDDATISSQNLWLSGGTFGSDLVNGIKAALDGTDLPFRPEWPYWNATRIIPSTINEFPYFSFLYGDLHAHLIALPLTLLTTLLLIALWRGQHWRTRYVAVLAALLGFAVGAARATNTWDYPTYALIGGAGVLVIALKRGRNQTWERRWPRLIAVLLAFGFGLIGPWLPWSRYLATGDYGAIQFLGSDVRMSLRDLLVLYGLWLWVLIPFGIGLIRRWWSRNTVRAIGVLLWLWIIGTLLIGPRLAPAAPPPPGRLSLLVYNLSNGLLLEPLRQSAAVIVILLPLMLISLALLWTALRQRISRRDLFPLIWATAGIALLVLSETVVLPGAGRMNTVFKFSYQAWVLLALAAAHAGYRMWIRTKAERGAIDSFGSSPFWRVVWRGGLIVLVLAALLYPLTATPAKIADRFVPDAPRSLDGMAWMDTAQVFENAEVPLGPDAAAIRWMRQNIAGTPTVLEAATAPYHWNSRIATWTGLPTIIGWDGHQKQQRAPAQASGIIDGRRELVRQLYTMPDTTQVRRWLDTYGVGVIYVGPLERAVYGNDANAATFNQLVIDGDWQLTYDQHNARIYTRVAPAPAPASLPPATTPGVPAPDPLARITLAVPPGQLPAVDGYADWPWLGQHQWAAIMLWLLVFELIGLLAWPWAALVVRSHGAAAWGVSKILGLLLLGWLVWLPTSLHFWRFTRLSVIAGLLGVAALSWLAWRGGAGAHIRATWQRNRRTLLATEAVFIALFAFWTLLRAANPDLWHPYWGGEKPFEFGFLNAVLRSPQMPPVDPFFSGGTINYYYYGLLLVGLPMKLLGLDPAIGFNLAVATVGALIGVGAWSVGLAIARRWQIALLTLIGVAIIGNLAGAIPVGSSSGLAGVVRAYQACDQPASEPRPACAPVAGSGDVDLGATVVDALRYGTLDGFAGRLGSQPWFWGPSRVTVTEQLNTINEFPYWSMVFADLHPHLIALPMTLLVVLLAWEATRRRRWRTLWPVLAAAALTIGALAPSNAWDVPTYALLFVAALVFGQRASGIRQRASDVRHQEPRYPLSFIPSSFAYRLAPSAYRLSLGIGTVLIGLVLYTPFFGSYRAPIGGIWPIRIGTPLLPWLAIYGLFLLIIVGWLLLPRRMKSVRPAATFGIVSDPRLAHPNGHWLMFAMFGLMVIGLALVVWLAQSTAFAPMLEASIGVRLVLIGLLVLLVPRLLNRSTAPTARWAVLLATIGALVALGVESIFVRDHLAPRVWSDGPGNAERMNTVFKFGYQVWVLWALAAALLLPRLRRGLRRSSPVVRGVWMGVLAVLITMAFVFTIFGPISRAATRFAVPPQGLTLDGLAFMDTGTFSVNGGSVDLADDHAAIRWITQNITGTPVLLQSEQFFYRDYGIRIAANTGLPTIVSALHADEQRPGELVAQRVRDIQRIYSGTDEAETYWLLNKYGVAYVYVGQIERLRDPIGVQKFATMSGLQQVFQHGSATIYRTTPQLPALALQWRPNQPVLPSSEPPPNAELAAALARYEAEPTNAGLAFDAGRLLWNNGQAERAATILRSAADLHPTDVALHQLLGDVLLSLGRYDEMIRAYREGYEAQPTPENLTKLGTGYLAWGRVDADQLSQAERIFGQASAEKPSLPDPQYHLGQVYEQLGDTARARQAYEQYLELAPPDAIWIKAAREALNRLQ